MNDFYAKKISDIKIDLKLKCLKESFKYGSKRRLVKTYNSINFFANLANNFLAHVAPEEFIRKGAFYAYQIEAYHFLKRAYIEFLSCYYSIGNVLLRNSMEIVLRGAFWECFAHKRFRDNSKILSNDKKGKALLELVKDLLNIRKKVSSRLEENSVTIFDIIEDICDKQDLRKEYIPDFIIMIKQLNKWDIFNSIPKALTKVYYKFYEELSKPVHAAPLNTDVGRRLQRRYALTKVHFLKNELNDFLKIMIELVDVLIVIEINIYKDFIINNKTIRLELRKDLKNLKSFNLFYSYNRLSAFKKIKKN